MIEIINCQQGSDEWRAAKIGVPSASRFKDVMAQGQGKTRDEYLRQLAGEIITGIPMETYKNAAMDHGNEVEPEARLMYQMVQNVDVQQVGFVRNGRFGASPDGFVGQDGGVEIKRQAPHLLISRIRDGVGSDHDAQVQGNMMVCEREWWDLCAYYPGMPLYRKRIKRDAGYISRLKLGLEVFVEDLDKLVAQIRAYR